MFNTDNTKSPLSILSSLYNPSTVQAMNLPVNKQCLKNIHGLFPGLPFLFGSTNWNINVLAPQLKHPLFSQLKQQFSRYFYADPNNPNKVYLSKNAHLTLFSGLFIQNQRSNVAITKGKFNTIQNIIELLKEGQASQAINSAKQNVSMIQRQYQQQTSIFSMTKMILDVTPVTPTTFTQSGYLEALKSAFFITTASQQSINSAISNNFLAEQIITMRRQLYKRIGFNFTVGLAAAGYLNKNFSPLDQNLLGAMAILNSGFIGVHALNYIATLNKSLETQQPMIYEHLQYHAHQHLKQAVFYRTLPTAAVVIASGILFLAAEAGYKHNDHNQDDYYLDNPF